MVKILNWNAKGLGLLVKRRYLSDLIKDNHIDIVCIQETKKEEFSERMLRSLSTHVTHWTVLPSAGASGGIILGYNESLFTVHATYIKAYSISLHLCNKLDNFEWCLTTVYGPLSTTTRRSFLSELNDIGNLGIDAWLLIGDFNIIRRMISPYYV